MSTVTIINEDGEQEKREIVSEQVSLRLEDGSLFEPAVAQRVEFDHEGGMSQIKHQNCNKTRNRRESDEKPDIVVEGICTEGQLETLKSLKSQRELTLITDLYSGDVVVKRLTIEQNTDVIHFAPNGEEWQLAFEFQLQLKDGLPESQGTTDYSTSEMPDDVAESSLRGPE